MRFYGYYNALVAWFILVVLVGGYYSLGVFAPAMGKAFGWSAAQFGAVLSVTILGWGLTAPLVGVLVTKFGPRLIMAVGCLVTAGSLVGMAFVNELWHFYVLAFPLALGMDLGAALPAQQLMSNWFLKRRGTMIGLVMTGGAIGGMTMVPLVSIMINAFGTWRTAWLPLAAAALVGGVLALLLIRNRPQEMGQYVDGVSAGEAALAEAPGARTAHDAPPPKVYATAVSWSPMEAFKTPAFWLIIAAMSGLIWALNTVVAHQVAYLQGEVGLSPELAAATLGIVVGLSAVGRMTSGWLGDRIEPRKIMAAFLLTSALGVVLLLSARNVVGVYAYVILFGLSYGGTFIPQPALLANYFGAKHFATILGLQSPITTVIGALSPIVAGLIKDATGSYAIAWLMAIAACLIAVVCAYLARPPRGKEVSAAAPSL